MTQKDKDGYLVIHPNEDTNVLAGRSRNITTDITLDKPGIIIPTSPYGQVARVLVGEKLEVTITNTGNKHILIRKGVPICHVMQAFDSAKPTAILAEAKPKVNSAKATYKKPVAKPTTGAKK